MVRGTEMGQEREGPGVGVGGEGVSRMEQSRRQALSPGHLVSYYRDTGAVIDSLK